MTRHRPSSRGVRARVATLAIVPLVAACATTARATPPVESAGGVRAAVARSAPALTCTPPAAPVIRSALYFGQRRAGGGDVTPEEWATFLAREITPRFGGLTVLTAEGQWLGPDGPLVREPSRIVVILHPDSEGPRAAIADVIRQYRTRFDQQSVLWETTSACAAF